MLSSSLQIKILSYYCSNAIDSHQDIIHTQEVAHYTKLIASMEGLSSEQQDMLESAAWLHDIGCPQSVIRYGNSLPANQQMVGREVAAELLAGERGYTDQQREWLIDVVGTHHQFEEAKRLQFTPLFEADLIVNILSGYYKRENAPMLYSKLMTSESGKRLFNILIN